MIKYRKKDLFRKFGIGSRLLEVLYVKSKKKTQVPICLFEVPICLIEVPNCPDADLSWCRNVSHRCRSVLVPICPDAEVSRIHDKIHLEQKVIGIKFFFNGTMAPFPSWSMGHFLYEWAINVLNDRTMHQNPV